MSKGTTVLVTGGGGSIGSELVRQLLPAKPAKIVLFDIYENTVYELYHEIAGKARESGIEIVTEIGSITHMPALEEVFDRRNPRVVFHAAAHKHVPLMESNPREAIENNVFGTLNVVRMAHERGCSHFILISTDKAVNPANVMGATKTHVRDDRAVLRPGFQDCVRLGEIRQCVGLARLGHSLVQTPVEGGRPHYADSPRYHSLLHDHPGGRAACYYGRRSRRGW